MFAFSNDLTSLNSTYASLWCHMWSFRSARMLGVQEGIIKCTMKNAQKHFGISMSNAY